MKWTEDEVAIVLQYERTNKSCYALFNEINNTGFKRTYKAVARKIENMGLRKPKRYTTNRELRLGYLDIETSNLKASIGVMLSWCIKPRDKNEVIGAMVTKEDMFNGTYDAKVVESLMDEMNNYDLLFTYYGSKFDIPFIRTRCLDHNIRFPVYREVSHKDLYYMVRSKLKLHNNRLGTVCEFFGIQGKTPVDPRLWRDGMYGNQKALKQIYKHNEEDVKILERMHKRIEPYCPPTVVPL
tara:strand:- start:827 stop:1546 length:720 start_codon:yes stop_codon:yes gene_type:complete